MVPVKQAGLSENKNENLMKIEKELLESAEYKNVIGFYILIKQLWIIAFYSCHANKIALKKSSFAKK